jgi:hypothetical protein
MRDERTNSARPARTHKHCPACGQSRSLCDFYTAVDGSPSGYCKDCQRALSRLTTRRRQAAMRLLIATHPEDGPGCSAWSAAIARPPATARRGVAGMAERSARRPRRVAVVDAPSARAASLASSAALPRPPSDGLTRPSSRAVDPPGIPPDIPPGIPPATDGGGHPYPLGRICPGHVPFGGPVGGVVRPRRAVRFARLIDRRVRALGQAFGLRRLRRHADADRIATQGGAAA